jgi:hypothetical protein
LLPLPSGFLRLVRAALLKAFRAIDLRVALMGKAKVIATKQRYCQSVPLMRREMKPFVGLVSTAAALSIMVAATSHAATKKPAAKSAVPEKSVPGSAFAATPAAASRGPRAPEAVKLRETTKQEAEANAIWNIRAALNIAALQCQFLPFLATVKTYNDILRQHSEELDRTRLAMMAHFKRYDGAKYQSSFDQYTTRTYNSFSTIDAQLPFCEMAGVVGREVLSLPKGSFGPTALRLNPLMRKSLEPGVGMPSSLIVVDIAPRTLPEFTS